MLHFPKPDLGPVALSLMLVATSAIAEEDPAPVPEAGEVAASRAAGAASRRRPNMPVPVARQKPKTASPAVHAEKPAAAVVFRDKEGRHCIGGVECASYCAATDRNCTAEFNYMIELDKPTYIAAIQLNAHDDVGKTRRSKLVVRVNGRLIGEQPVYRLGSSVSLAADVVGQVITIESAHQQNGFLRGGDEAVIWDVFVFGRPIE